ncbi:hypothetical protein ES702_01564 [subsurface metagenome]
MPRWRSRSVSNNDTSDPQLEAGLAHHHNVTSRIPEESEDDATTDVNQEPKTDASETAARSSMARRPTFADDYHVEDIQSATEKHEDPSPLTRTKTAASKFFKWPRGSKQEEQDDAAQTDEKTDHNLKLKKSKSVSQAPPEYAEEYTNEAKKVVESFTVPTTDYENTEPKFVSPQNSHPHKLTVDRSEEPEAAAAAAAEAKKHKSDIDYVPTPEKYKPSIFGAILTSRLNDLQEATTQATTQQTTYQQQSRPHTANPQSSDYLDLARRHAPFKPKHQRSTSADPFAGSSGASTPTLKPKWYEKPEHASSLANLLVQAGISSSSPAVPETSGYIPRRGRDSPPLRPSGLISTAVEMIHGGTPKGRSKINARQDAKYDVVAEVADIIARRRYLIKLCGAFMRYGAPTHRIEEYLAASARALLIDAQFMYIPGAMMCTFIDSTIQSNSVELVRKAEGLDFARLKDTFNVYKCVIHEKYTAEEGIFEIDHIQSRADPYGIWFRIFIFGLASVVVGPFSFQSRPMDFAPIFVLGCLLGFLQLKVVPRSEQFSNVFEVCACVAAAFIARGLGSIKWSDGSYIFCFSAVAQSSIAMILPGFMVLNSALELQGRSIVSGSVRMVYAIIYVIFLGFGLLVGTTVFGLIKRDATTDVTCSVPAWFSPADGEWKLIYTRFIWAPMFACCVGLIYRAKWRQLPVMALIAVCGHQANFWISTQLSSNLQVANAVGAFVIGCMANLYSRLFHGLAAAAMLPAIYCQVPGGLAASGSLVAGINSSNQIFGNSSSVSVINNGTQGFVAAQDDPSSVYGGTIFNVGYGMVQVAIGISVGLYMSALVVYPFGKRNSGLFSF